MKKYLIYPICFLFIFLFPINVEAVDQLIVEAPTLNPAYEGETEISGLMDGYGTLPSGEKVPLNGHWNAAWIAINGKFYNTGNAGNQMFDYTITKVDDEHYNFTFRLPNGIVLHEGDKVSSLVIPGNVDNANDYPQLSSKFSGEMIVAKKQEQQGEVTARYHDVAGNKLAPDMSQTGVVGTSYQTEQKIIDGYTFKEVQGNATGLFTDSPQEVTYVYEKTPILGANIVVHYVDDAGNQLLPDILLTGNIGAHYKSEQKVIDGYRFNEVQGNTTGLFTDQLQEITYVYTKSPVLGGTITVQYIDDEGNSLLPDVLLTGNVGAPYQSEQKMINGYTIKGVQGISDGNFTNEEQLVLYIYSKDKEVLKDSSNANIDQNSVATDITHSEASKKIPQLGESSTKITTIIGCCLLLVLGYVMKYRKV